MKKNVLLIGGAGYVGTVITDDFLSKGYSVTVLDNFEYGNYNAVISYLGNKNYRIIKGDLSDKETLEQASAQQDVVIILAGLVGDPITKKYPQASAIINEKGIKECIDFYDDKDIDNLIFISTCSNYGLIKEDEKADENFELKPLSLYAKAKVSIEQYLLKKEKSVKYSATVLRFATAFGLSPRMRFDLSVSEFVRDVFFGEELYIFDEHTWRPYCHVRDFAELLDIVIKANRDKIHFEVFNAGGDINNHTKKMIVDLIKKYVPSANIKYGTNGSDPRNYRVDFEKVSSVLNFKPSYTVEDGVVELLAALEMGFYKSSLESKEFCR